ncbi:MAG: hypothetical protein ACJAR0_004526 [Candidatus Azotimanducaceae bacterium]|jgi:hypothetical protein
MTITIDDYLISIQNALEKKGYRNTFPIIQISSLNQDELAFEGSGIISQNEFGKLILDLMVTSDDTKWLSEANRNVPHDHPVFFGFEAKDGLGNLWRSVEPFQPYLNPFESFGSFHRKEPFNLRAEINRIQLFRQSDDAFFSFPKIEPFRVSFVIPRKLNIPTPSKHVTETSSNVVGETTRIDHDHYETTIAEYRFWIRSLRDSELMVGAFECQNTDQDPPPFIGRRIGEVLTYLTSTVFEYSVALSSTEKNGILINICGLPRVSTTNNERNGLQDG